MPLIDVLGIHSPLVQIILRCVVVYVAILLGMRLTGRRQLGQMTPFDLVLILLISNAVQNAMVGPDTSVLGGLVAAATLLFMNWITGAATDRSVELRKALEGQPILLVNDGQFIASHMKLAQLTEELVLQAIREHGFEGLEQVHMAVLEIDGTISIVPGSSTTVRTRHHVRAVRPGGN
ncbi:MAG TPA: YetF domain-containing protein [Candidatus Saccharimonadales bacterium]|nr:YetF domain-containing protein [Candidatus Saccharimonadales bacterium]